MSIKINKEAIEQMSSDQRSEVEQHLAQMEAWHADNPLLRYLPYAKQREFHRIFARVKAFYGGNRAGKTTAGIADDLIQAVDLSCLPAQSLTLGTSKSPISLSIVEVQVM